MAMGRRRKSRQQLWVETRALAQSPGYPFYERLSRTLGEYGFDSFVEEQCLKFYAEKMVRSSMVPSVYYFRLLLVGFFEGIDSERSIAWRMADSITLRVFLGFELSGSTPDHSTVSRTRRLIDLETHQAIFAWALQGLLRGKTLGIDATTLEANAAMRSSLRRDTGESYEKYLERLAEASGIGTPTRADLARFDRKRKDKKTSNDDWKNPHDPDAKITRMEDGRTHLAHKAEHAVDMETCTVVVVTVQPTDRGDTSSLETTFEEVAEVIEDPEAAEVLEKVSIWELVVDKGYHSNEVLKRHHRDGQREPPPDSRPSWSGASAPGTDVGSGAPIQKMMLHINMIGN